MLNYLTIQTSAELICLITALFCLYHDKSLAWRGIILLLLSTCLAKFSGIYIKGKYLADPSNARLDIWVYNILLIVQAVSISAMFVSLFRGYKKLSLTIFSGLSLFIIIYLLELLTHGLYEKHLISYTTIQVLIILNCFIFFYLLMKDGRHGDIRFEPAFWWVSGTLFFYFGSVMTTVFYNIIRDSGPQQVYTSYISKALNIMLYSCWTFAFILRKWTNQRSENS